MIEILNSKRMTLVIVILIVICIFVVIIEEWFTNSLVSIASADLSPVKTNSQHTEYTIESTISKTNWRNFLQFLSLVNFFGGISGLCVKYRQNQLRSKSLARFRKNTGGDHTLINMNNLTGKDAYQN